MRITATIEGTDKVIAQIDKLSLLQRSAIRETIGVQVLKLKRYIQREKLSGQVLNKRTGNLARSIDTAVVSSEAGTVGVVSTNVKYGRAHEYGFTGAVQVKAHLRLIKQAWGRTMKTPVRAQIKAHTMNLKLPERSFLRSALRDKQRSIVLALNAALKDAAEKALGGTAQ